METWLTFLFVLVGVHSPYIVTNAKNFAIRNETSQVTVPSTLLIKLLEVSRSLQKLIPAQAASTNVQGTSDEGRVEVGSSTLFSLALRHHALLQQRNEDLLTQLGRCTAQIEALQEDKRELRQQLREYKHRGEHSIGVATQSPSSGTDGTTPVTSHDPMGGLERGNLVLEASPCSCSGNLTDAEAKRRNLVSDDECACGGGGTQEEVDASVTDAPSGSVTTFPDLLGEGVRVKDCAGHQNAGATESGVYEIFPSECLAVRVWCDLDTDSGGWTVFLNRQEQPQQENFTRTWQEYRNGFGDVTKEFWLGNEALHQLTAKDPHVLRVDAEDFNGSRRWGEWERFRVDDEDHNYKLQAVLYSSNSTLGDGLLWHSGMQFSTIDADNDKHKGSCADEYKGGWWYNVCHNANPTGILINSDDFDSVGWVYWSPRRYKWASLKNLQMKIRPQSFGTSDPTSAPRDCSKDSSSKGSSDAEVLYADLGSSSKDLQRAAYP